MRKRLIQGGLVGLGSAVLVLGLWGRGLFERLEYVTWAWRVRIFAVRSEPHPQIKVILLDQASLDWGKNQNGWAWPWPRTVYGALLDFCRRGGAKGVAFDVLFTEPSGYDVADDLALSEAIGKTPGYVGALMLAQAGGATNWPGYPLPRSAEFAGLESWLQKADVEQVLMPRVLVPIPEASTNATLLGNVSAQPDLDDQFRRAPLFRVFNGAAVPSLGLAAYLAAEARAGSAPPVRVEENWLIAGSRRIPIDRRASAILNFHGKRGLHQTFSAATLIQSELKLQAGEKPVLDPQVVKDCYVLFGFSAPGLLDLRPTPLSRVCSGVEFHATCLDNLLTGGFLRSPAPGVVMLVTLLLGLASGAVMAVTRYAWESVFTMACFTPIPILVAFAAYPLGWWWPLMMPLAAVAFALVGGIVLNYATEGRQKAFLKRAFKHYLGEEVIDQIIADPSQLRLGGEKRELTLFFSDIEKFSSFSEKLDPGTLTTLLNEYLTDMTNIILEEGGYLDKYIGDAIVAFWNAPVAQPDHAVRAVRTLLRCQRRLAERRPHYQANTQVVVKARIGMNTGEVTVGNMGSGGRFNYTVLGDAANLASRLEGANKAFGTYNLISETTWQLAQEHFIGRELGRLRVVGRGKPVVVYEALGFAGEPLPGFVLDFEQGVRLCREGQWQEALPHFERHPGDPPCAAYLNFCRHQLHRGGGDWDGIWSLTEK